MAVSRFLFCAVSLALLDFKTVANAGEPSVSVANDKVKNDCLAKLSEARQAAALGSLTAPQENFFNGLNHANGLGKVIYEAVLQGTELKATKEDLSKGPIAVFALPANPGETLDCSAAVESWQKGFSIFGQTAPASDKLDEYMKNAAALSFLTLYNPAATTGQCTVATCTSDNANRDKEKYALVCLTSPAIPDKAPMFRRSRIAVSSQYRCRIGRRLLVLTHHLVWQNLARVSLH
ncbi:hypothetical protein ACSSS7_003171 [Eimeria intestinalis]